MQAHGSFKIEVIDNFIHTYPVGGFNKEGITQLNKEIIKASPSSAKWVLFEHPKDVAGLTPDGIDEITKTYKLYSEMGCVAIALEANKFWASVFSSDHFKEITIPIYSGQDEKDLHTLLQNSLVSS